MNELFAGIGSENRNFFIKRNGKRTTYGSIFLPIQEKFHKMTKEEFLSVKKIPISKQEFINWVQKSHFYNKEKILKIVEKEFQ